MTSKVYIKNISELLPESFSENDIRGRINSIRIDKRIVDMQFSSPLYLNAFVTILVLSGNATVQINYKSYPVSENSIILFSVSHLFNFSSCSTDFKCISLFVSKEFIEDTDATDMIYRRIKYGARLYNNPVIELREEDISVLSERMLTIDKVIDNVDHFYHKELILNSLFAFYLDLGNVIERGGYSPNDGNFTRYESLIKSFIELLINNYRKEHKVEFYSSRLNITSHYLTLIVKRITGQTVNSFIFDMLYSEARSLLIHSKLSIQEIALLLNFSDQSSFGKFFKRKSGVPPVDFRKGGLFVDK